MIFIRSVIERMTELGLNNTALARRMKASRPYIVKLLHGDVTITFATASRIARAPQVEFIPLFVENGFSSKLEEPAPAEPVTK